MLPPHCPQFTSVAEECGTRMSADGSAVDASPRADVALPAVVRIEVDDHARAPLAEVPAVDQQAFPATPHHQFEASKRNVGQVRQGDAEGAVDALHPGGDGKRELAIEMGCQIGESPA